MCRSSESPLDRILSGLRDLPAWIAEQPAGQLGEVIIKNREIIDRTEAVAAEATRRFENAGGYKADGFLGMVPWLRVNGKLSGGAAAERVETARQLKELPRTEEALARGEIGYQHAVAMARAAEHVGAAQVRKAEASLLKAAETMDPGQFGAVAKNFEHQVDAEAVLADANRAYARRYLQIGEVSNGLVRLEGQVVPEAAAMLRMRMEPFMKPAKGDERTAGQRAHDALVEICRRGSAGNGKSTGAAPRPSIIIKASLDTLAGIDGAPAGELEWGGTIPAETVTRLRVTKRKLRPSPGSPASGSSSRNSRTPRERSRPRPVARWWRGMGTASSPAATGRRPGATDITSSTGRTTGRPGSTTSGWSAARTTGKYTKRVGNYGVTKTAAGSRRHRRCASCRARERAERVAAAGRHTLRARRRRTGRLWLVATGSQRGGAPSGAAQRGRIGMLSSIVNDGGLSADGMGVYAG